MDNSILKKLGIFITLLGALMIVLAMFVFTDLLDQHFNWFITLSTLLVIAGLFVHIIMNKKLPLEDED